MLRRTTRRQLESRAKDTVCLLWSCRFLRKEIFADLATYSLKTPEEYEKERQQSRAAFKALSVGDRLDKQMAIFPDLPSHLKERFPLSCFTERHNIRIEKNNKRQQNSRRTK